MSDFVVQKPMRTKSLGFGSSSEAVVTRLIDWPKHCDKRFLCKHRAVSLSLSLLLRPAIIWMQKIVRRAWSGAKKHTKSYNLVRLCVRWSRYILDKNLLSDACHGRIQRGGGDRGSGPPLKNHKNIGFPSNIDPDPLKITKLPSQHSMVGHWLTRQQNAITKVFRWWADGGPF